MKRSEYKIIRIKIILHILGVLLFFVSFTSESSAESRYTRERSEALFHLIDWHEYTPDTFLKALKEQKPIFLLISAPAWCYWCHVYESEDYLYHPELYSFINENFIAIFVDSDKRPDLTKKYLEGGWPSTTVFAPDLRRIFGFSGPQDPHALRVYFKQIISYLKDKSFKEFNDVIRYEERESVIPEKNQLLDGEKILLSYVNTFFDETYGGFLQGNLSDGREERKFPAGFTHKYLLEKYDETGNRDYLNIVKTTFDNQYTEITELQSAYHLYDPVEGGFHRYSTKRDWSIPHYEKMLSDQAKLIRAYAHLLKVTNDSKVNNVVKGAISFVLTKFHDDEGGFYTSQDAYLEHEYYELPGEERENIKPPYIDRTRIIDANSMMISTFLYLYDTYGDKEYEEIARKSLNFIRDNMMSIRGAYYYYDYDKKRPFLTGQLVSNSWVTLTFLDGYTVLKEKSYLENAIKTAQFALHNLYDWNSGGFFERNSQDVELYAPYERIDLSKPYQENAVFSYAMLRLYLITEDLAYLESGLKTLGYLLAKTGGLDEMYYAIKASKLADKNNLIDIYIKNKEQIAGLLEKEKADFFLDKLFEKKQDETSLDDAPRFRDDFASASFIILAVLAFFAGILSFLSPCTLPVLSAYFAQGFSARKGEILKHTIFFFLGLATVFSVFGMGATLAGSIFRENRLIFTQVAATVIIIFGVLEIFGKGFSGLNIYLKGDHKTPIGSYIFGSVFAIGWSACIGPILASLLLLSATSGTVLKGTVLLFIYALGLAIPLTFISLFFDRIRSKRFWKILQGKGMTFSVFKKQIMIHSTYLISGLILIVLGILIFNDYLYKLNQLTFQTDYVQNLIIKGEEQLKDIFMK
jgi:cytochrome c-type biogenesis protein